MIITNEFKISLSNITYHNYISTKGLLGILQDTAEMHSASIGVGVTDIENTKRSWAIINWKVKIIERPKYGDILTVKTWSRYSTKLYCYRDFEILNENGDIVAIATSKWILIDAETGKIAKIDENLIAKYLPEDKSVFNIAELPKMQEPENYIRSVAYKVRKSDIDVNNHVNNLNYIDMAIEVETDDVSIVNTCTEFEILYKHQIKLDDKITANYCIQNNDHYVVIKSDDGNVLHAIMKFN